MEVRVDLTNIPDNTVPEGVYECRVDKVEVAPSKRTPGSQNLNVELVITSAGDFNGRKLFDNISLQPQVLWRVRDFVNACGVFPGPEGFRSEDLLGHQVRATVLLEPQSDNPSKMRSKVSGYSAM